MSQNKKSFFSPKTLLFDGVLTVGFLFFISEKLQAFVPAHTEVYRQAFAFFGGVCLTGVFFMALQMFRVTLTDQLRRSWDKRARDQRLRGL